MPPRTPTKEEQILVLETQIKERALIIYIDESALEDEDFPKDYKRALIDEIKNHNAAIEEYKLELEKLKNK